MSDHQAPFVISSRRSGPIKATLNLFSSIWFGVTLLTLLFIYSFIGSAGIVYPAALSGGDASSAFNLLSAEGWRHTFPREFFDVSEMQWFGADARWIWLPTTRQELPPWTFRLLILLFCIAITTVTIRRIPFTLVNAGVWGIHTGIVVLCIGCAIYFGRKFEGDITIVQRDALITVPGVQEPVRMRILPDASATVGEGENAHQVKVVRLEPNYEILTEPYAGEKTYAITFSVDALRSTHPDIPNGRFLRQILVGYPQFAEDIVLGPDGPTRAVKVLGKRLADEDLKIELDYSPANHFYLNNRPALYARVAGDQPPGPYDDQGWIELPLPRLPRFRDRLPARETIWPENGVRTPQPRPLALDAGTVDDDVQLEVTGYLHYADITRRWVDTNDEFNPMVTFELSDLTRHPEVKTDAFQLFAKNPFGGRVDLFQTLLGNLLVEFHWIEAPAALPDLTPVEVPSLDVEVLDAGVKQTIALSELRGSPPREIEGTSYRISLQGVLFNQPLPFAGQEASSTRASVAVVRISSPTKGTFTRMAAERPDLLHDITEGGNFHASPVDENIKLVFRNPVRPRLVIAAGPEPVGTQAIFRHASGQVNHRPLAVGVPVTLAERELAIRLTNRLDHAVQETRARIVPPHQRANLSQVGRTRSLVHVQLRCGDEASSVWVPFSLYNFEGPWRSSPRVVTLRDGRTIELLYGRERQKLPTWVALERFRLDTYTGGTNPRGFYSALRFARHDGWSDVVWIRENRPTEFAGHWFFQAEWDPPFRFGSNSGGWNHTGLGVGNREGIWTMMTGVSLSILGMIYAFYVKPVIKRRRRETVRARIESDPDSIHRDAGRKRRGSDSAIASAQAGGVKT